MGSAQPRIPWAIIICPTVSQLHPYAIVLIDLNREFSLEPNPSGKVLCPWKRVTSLSLSQLGIKAVLDKPVSAPTLLATIRKVLES